MDLSSLAQRFVSQGESVWTISFHIHIIDGAPTFFRSNACELAAVGLGWDRAFPFDDSRQHVDYHSRRWIPLGSQNVEWKGFQLPMHRDIV